MAAEIAAGAVVVPCNDLTSTLSFFTDHLAFKVRLIFPADDPVVAVVQGQGLTLRLDRDYRGPSPLLQLCPTAELVADISPPKGIQIEWLGKKNDDLFVPSIAQSFVLTRKEDSQWNDGRAGMLYRDLVPDRQGGRFICSHIKIPSGGDVPDYVHHHHVRFQMIFCYKGWVEVVYEDQGPPFRMQEGDCVLQPPHIRHRVLSCSPELEVIEVSCPGKHNTLGDPEMSLPTAAYLPDRLFSGQRFARYQACHAHWNTVIHCPGWEQSNTGLDAATGGLAGVRVLRTATVGQTNRPQLNLQSSPEFVFRFVLCGSVSLHVSESCVSGMVTDLCEGDAFVLCERSQAELTEPTPETRILEVSLPAFSYDK